ncbi:hypothetical protein [Lysinibacillus capsici]|uniref:hypothetical protein n=1 Tax=Lysinibacillus capsici TaxID=2115968 RepID=UPI0034E5DE07
MSQLKVIVKQDEIDKRVVKLEELHLLGQYNNIGDYCNQLVKCVNSISHTLPIHSYKPGLLFETHKQKTSIKIEDRTFAAFLICNPVPGLKKEKPNGLIIEHDLSFIQMKEVLLHDVRTKELYCFEYSYHYAIWDYEDNIEKYFFRYDKDILLGNPPQKKLYHLHVIKKNPHFESPIINLNGVLEFILHNWDVKRQCLDC